MTAARKKPACLKMPDVVPGNWQGEIVGSTTVNFGQIVQPGPPRQSVEFSYIILPTTLTMPEVRFEWPGVVMIMTPTPMKTQSPNAGSLFRGGATPCLTLSLVVTRAQFSDMLGHLEGKRFKRFHFTLEEKIDDSWPIHSWGMTVSFP